LEVHELRKETSLTAGDPNRKRKKKKKSRSSGEGVAGEESRWSHCRETAKVTRVAPITGRILRLKG